MGANNYRIYYSHSKMIYGTQQEVEEFEFLKNKFPEANIICPHNTVGELYDSKDSLYIVDFCSKVIVSEFNGFIGFSVFVEIGRALSNNASVFVLRRHVDEFYLVEVTGMEIINKNDLKNQFGKVLASNNNKMKVNHD